MPELVGTEGFYGVSLTTSEAQFYGKIHDLSIVKIEADYVLLEIFENWRGLKFWDFFTSMASKSLLTCFIFKLVTKFTEKLQ